MSKLSIATTENILTTPFMTGFNHVYYNEGTKKFPKCTLSMEVNDDMNDFKKVCEKIEKKTPYKFNKDNTKQYIKFNISKEIKVFDINNKQIQNAEIDELLKSNDARLLFSVVRYNMGGIIGLSFKVHQIQVKEKEDLFKNCFFDE